MQHPRRSSLKLDIASAYLLTAARMGSWLVIAAMLFRRGSGIYAMIALLRATLGLLNYFAMGIAPAVLYLATRQPKAPTPAILVTQSANSPPLDYAGPGAARSRPIEFAHSQFDLFANAKFTTTVLCALAVIALVIYDFNLWTIHSSKSYVQWLLDDFRFFVVVYGAGMILRIRSEPNSGILQAYGHITADNLFLAGAEILWVALSALCRHENHFVADIAASFFLSSVALHFARKWYTIRTLGRLSYSLGNLNRKLAKSLLAFGSFIAITQLADFLYAPTDYILIDRLLSPVELATYAPAVQVDAALLLSITALAAVLLPRAAIEHGKGNLVSVRQYYFRGTLASFALLLTGAAIMYAISPIAFRLWLHDPLPATRAILPLVLIHTVIGGSSAVGRSILLASGKVKPFTIAVLLAGLSNVILSYTFVRYFHLGLPGIIYGTIFAVTARCALWMPWYIIRTLGSGDVHPEKAVESFVAPESL